MSDQRTQRPRDRALCVAAAPDEQQDLDELSELLLTAGVVSVGRLHQRRTRADPNTYLGPGKVQEAKALAERCEANLIACDDELSARQERNLEAALGLPVVDRSAVILDIFATHAASAEGKLQVELAQLEYNLARMRGLWSHLERLGGGIGTRGPGETQIETDRRLARNRIAALRRRLERVHGSRSVMRSERERAGIARIALAGYTNAGKSTLLNALVEAYAPTKGAHGAGVAVADRLFHTLDPTTRLLRIEGRPYLLTDTVGFIRKLPHQLVEAFAATLEESTRADLILHVLDASAGAEQMERMRRSVEGTLAEIGADEIPRLLVLSKADLLDRARAEELCLTHPDAVLLSARSGSGIETLAARIDAWRRPALRSLDLLFPYAEGTSLAELHALGTPLMRTDTPEGVRVRALLPAALVARFARFAVAV
ncbi:MAG TPA: GTPase HflX [Solirubrobacteraceae bacterium]|nr:GTPase HflX [Solirubrobacteraceae bacterium]